MAIRNAIAAQELMDQTQINIDKWLTLIDIRIDSCIKRKQDHLIINNTSSLSHLFLDGQLREAVIKELKHLKYHVVYYAGSYSKPRYILIEWGSVAVSERDQEILEREEIDKQLKELLSDTKSLKIT